MWLHFDYGSDIFRPLPCQYPSIDRTIDYIACNRGLCVLRLVHLAHASNNKDPRLRADRHSDIAAIFATLRRMTLTMKHMLSQPRLMMGGNL
jgi:hypothetical protein